MQDGGVSSRQRPDDSLSKTPVKKVSSLNTADNFPTPIIFSPPWDDLSSPNDTLQSTPCPSKRDEKLGRKSHAKLQSRIIASSPSKSGRGSTSGKATKESGASRHRLVPYDSKAKSRRESSVISKSNASPTPVRIFSRVMSICLSN